MSYLENVLAMIPGQFDHAVYAGPGNGIHLSAILNRAEHITLVEPNPQNLDVLKKKAAGRQNLRLVPKAMATEVGQADLHVTVPAGFASLAAPEGLMQLFPNLKLKQTVPVETVTLANLLEELALDASKANLLILDIRGLEGTVLEHTAPETLRAFSTVVVRAAEQPLYAAEPAGIETVLTALNRLGFAPIELKDLQPPFITLAASRPAGAAKDQQTTIDELTQQLTRAQQKSTDYEISLSKIKESYRSEQAELESAVQNKSEEVAALTEQLAIVDAESEKRQKELSDKTRQLTQLEAQAQELLETANKANDEKTTITSKVKELEKSLEEREHQAIKSNNALQTAAAEVEKLRGELGIAKHECSELKDKLLKQSDALIASQQKAKEQLEAILERQKVDAANQAENMNLLKESVVLVKRFENQFDKKLTNGVLTGVKQLEAFISLKGQFNEGFIETLGFHGWPISSDLGLFLAKLIKTNNYDLVIEFGSGTSTALFAECYKELAQKKSQKLIEDTMYSPKSSMANDGERIVNDLPKRVTTFEHNVTYLEKTQELLNGNGVTDYVALHHTPLIDISIEETGFLFYDCARQLSDLANLMNHKQSSILVFIDGPPESTCENARYPTLYTVINFLAKHKIDVVLDDYNRVGEKLISQKWMQVLDKRSIKYKTEEIPLEKGAWFCQINQ